MLRTLPDCEVRVRMIRMPNTCNCNTAKLRDKMQITVLYLHLDEYGHLLVLLSVQAVLTNGSFLGYCQYGSVLPITAVCASIYHTTHTVTLTLTLILTLSLTLNLTLTLNFTLISSYLINKHQCTHPICPPIDWRQGYATNQQLSVRTVSRLVRVLTGRLSVGKPVNN